MNIPISKQSIFLIIIITLLNGNLKAQGAYIISGKIKETSKDVLLKKETNKLFPTDIGKITDNFMSEQFKKFLLSQSISSNFQNDYFNKIQKRNSTSHLLEANGLPVDIFSKLLDERIIFLSEEIDSDVLDVMDAHIRANIKHEWYLDGMAVCLKPLPK